MIWTQSAYLLLVILFSMQNYLQSELLKLEMFPRLGRVVPEIDREDIREIILGK